MLRASKTYRQQIEKIPFRNHSYMTVTVGIFNLQAQDGARITSEMSYLANPTKVFEQELPTIRYATYEQDWWRADGSMYFPPEDSTDVQYNQGAISEDLNGTIRIEFDNAYEIKGLTIDFPPDAYPTRIGITQYGDLDIATWFSNSSSHFTTNMVFSGVVGFDIQGTTMSGNAQRFRIEQIQMGVGVAFNNKNLISVEKTEYVSPVSEDLPELNISVVVPNYDGRWDINNSESSINYLETGQTVELQYGYELDDGSTYWMDGASALLTSWSANAEEMSFEATDILSMLTDTYYGGDYYPNGETAYNLALAVLTDAGLDSRQYEIDEYLQEVTLYNPLPAVSHAECLQLIANASRARLRTDRTDGHIIIEFAAQLEISPERMTIDTDTSTWFSDDESVINGESQIDYAMYTKDYWTADGNMRFLPESTTASALTTGFISDQLTMADGVLYPSTTLYASTSIYPTADNVDGDSEFESHPTVSIDLDAGYTFYTLGINFLSNPPTQMILHCYLEGTEVESYTYPDDAQTELGDSTIAIELSNVIEHDFPEMDYLEIEVVSAPVYNRVYLSSVIFGEQTDFGFYKKNTTTYPLGTREERTKDVQVIKTIYSEGTEYQQIISDTVDLTDIDEYTFYLSQPSHGYVGIADESTTLTVTASSAYYVTFDTSSLTGSHEISVNGYTYQTAQTIYSYTINSTGVTQQWENPMISNDDVAGLVAEWVGNYLLNNAEYEVEYRGEPRLDAGDLAYLENDYVDGLMVRIEEHGISYNGALSGTAKCRLARS